MKTLNVSPSLTEQVYRAIVDEILDGRLKPGQHLVQEQLAATLGVSRQPIQQAMALLKADGMVQEVGRRGLTVAQLDLSRMRCHYDIRGLLDGYAARSAAEEVNAGKIDVGTVRKEFDEIFKAGADAIERESVRDQIRFDEGFHKLIYGMSGNTVLRDTVEPHWRYLRRVMAEVLMHAEPATVVWEQHNAIADAILAGKADAADKLAEDHVKNAGNRLTAALLRRDGPPEQESSVA
jgi:DNA-binding GntR family transcriptional regulator